jgi:acetolactate synthase-1/2/3 large subunit
MSDLDSLADELATAGVSRVYGVPGSGATLTIIDQLEQRNVPFQLVHFEGSAAIMAGTTARLGGGIGAALSIKGPGIANMIPGLAFCQFESLPVVALVEAYGPQTPAARAHKRLDQENLVSAVAKGKRFHAKSGPSFTDMADWAEREVPGPVVLELAGPVDEEERVPGAPPVPNNFDVAAAVAAAKRPVVVAGTLAIRRRWRDRLNSLSVPVFSTAAAKGVVDETLPHAAGVYTGVGLKRAPEISLLPEADLVIGFGLRSGEVLKTGGFTCPAINVDEITGNVHAGFEFEGISNYADAVLAALQAHRWNGDVPARPAQTLREHLLALPFGPAHVYAEAERRFDGKARLVLDTGYFCIIGEHVWRARRPEWCLGSGQGRYMGAAVPMAIAAALQDRSVPTILAVGDGGIGPFAAELKIAAAHSLPLMVILLSDGGFGSVRMRAIKDGLKQDALLMEAPSWLAAMEGLGLPGTKADDEDAVADALAAWQPESGPRFLEVSFDPKTYQDMVEGVRA